MANSVPTKTSFSSGNQPENRRGKAKRTKLLEALKGVNLTEEEFYKRLVTEGMVQLDEGKPAVALEIFDRLFKKEKPQLPNAELEVPEGASVSDCARILSEASLRGDVTPDQGAMLSTVINNSLGIIEKDELAKDIEEIKRKMAEEE